MKFYLNEVGLLQSWPEHIKEEIVEIKNVFVLLNSYRLKLLIKANFFREEIFQKLCQNAHEFYPFLALLGQLDQIKYSDEARKLMLKINPDVSNEQVRELLQLCLANSQEKIVSTTNDREITEEIYKVNCELSELNVTNIRGIEKLEYSLKHSPPCLSAKDVFERAEVLCPHLKFSKKSFSTARTREHLYRAFGYEQVLDLMLSVEELLYPFFSKKMSCTEKELRAEFEKITGVEFSPEDKETLKMFGSQRDADINGVTCQFDYHLKPEDDLRIYFEYFPKEDTIYFGHAGKHLDTVTRRK